MEEEEILNDLVPLGFTTKSELSVELVNPVRLNVQDEDGREFAVVVTPKCRLECLGNVICSKLNLPFGLGEIEIGDLKCDQYRTINEMDVDEKTQMKFHVCPLGELILKKESLTPSIIDAAIEYAELVSFAKLERNITKEFVEELKMMEEKKEDHEISGNLTSLIVSISYRGFLSAERWSDNYFYNLFSDSGFLSYFEKETWKIMNEKEESLKSLLVSISYRGSRHATSGIYNSFFIFF
jgi:hypothetical protein